MSLTRDTSHSSIGPCGPFEHSPFGDSLMHASTALFSCTLDCGENTGFYLEGGGQHRAVRKYVWLVIIETSERKVIVCELQGLSEAGHLKRYICARTAAGIRRDIDKKDK